MYNIGYCRRTFLATLAIICLTGLGVYRGMDVTLAIAGVVAAVAGANSYEKSNVAKAGAVAAPLSSK